MQWLEGVEERQQLVFPTTTAMLLYSTYSSRFRSVGAGSLARPGRARACAGEASETRPYSQTSFRHPHLDARLPREYAAMHTSSLCSWAPGPTTAALLP